MNRLINSMQQHAKRIVALALIVSLFWLAKPAEVSRAERASIASRFHFSRMPLPELPGAIYRSVRSVHPNLDRISAWVSSVGASVALNDLDGDGLPNDTCYVDTRTDQVLIAPVPGTPARYEPFSLNTGNPTYDAATMAPMGCLPGDLNEDGRMDVLVYYWGRTPIVFLHQSATASGEHVLNSMTYVQQELVQDNAIWNTNAATLADLDGDGHNDLIFGNYFPDGAKILDSHATATGLEQMQHSMSRAYNGGDNRIFLWQASSQLTHPTVQFQEIAGVLDEETTHGWTLAIGAEDLDGDLLPELYFANDFGPDRLLHNRSKPGDLQFVRLNGQKTLTTPNSKVVGRDSFKGMGVDFGDLNSDGWPDMFISNIAAEYALEESHLLFASTGETGLMQKGIAPYVDRSEPLGLSRSGWAWESRLGDFDNDSVLEALQATGFAKGTANRWPELHEVAMGNDELLSNPKNWARFQPGDDLSGHQHNPFFIRAKDGRYYDFAQSLRIDSTEVSRGIATADVDGDGDLDFAVANQWEPSYFYQNQQTNTDQFLGLHLLRSHHQTSSGTAIHSGHPDIHFLGHPAIGATATVYLPDGRKLVAQVDGGNGHSGARSPDLHFGLGELASATPLQVDLRWRDLNGQIHQETQYLSPGWHTILLGNNTTKEV